MYGDLGWDSAINGIINFSVCIPYGKQGIYVDAKSDGVVLDR